MPIKSELDPDNNDNRNTPPNEKEKGKTKKKKFAPRQIRNTKPSPSSSTTPPLMHNSNNTGNSLSSPSIVKQEYGDDTTKNNHNARMNNGNNNGDEGGVSFKDSRRGDRGRGHSITTGIGMEYNNNVGMLPQYKHNPFLPMNLQSQDGNWNNRYSQEQMGGLIGKQRNFDGRGRGRGRKLNDQAQLGAVYFTGDIAKRERNGLLSAKEQRLSEKLKKKEELKKAKELEKERKRSLKEEERKINEQSKGGGSGQFADADGGEGGILNEKIVKLRGGKVGRGGLNMHDDKMSAFLYTGRMLGISDSETGDSDEDGLDSDSDLNVSESSDEEFPLKHNDPLDPISLPFVPKNALQDLVDEGDILFEERKSQAEQEELILLQFPTHIPVERLFISQGQNNEEFEDSLDASASGTTTSGGNDKTVLKVKPETEENNGSKLAAAKQSQNKGEESKPSTTSNTATDNTPSGKDKFQGFDGIPSGKIGKIYVYKSGKCVFRGLGDSSPLVLIPGIPAAFKQEVVTVNKNDKTYSQLGNVTKKIVCCPDLESMLN